MYRFKLKQTETLQYIYLIVNSEILSVEHQILKESLHDLCSTSLQPIDSSRGKRFTPKSITLILHEMLPFNVCIHFLLPISIRGL